MKPLNRAALGILGLCLTACAPTAFRGYLGASAMQFDGPVGLGPSSGGVNPTTIPNDLRDDLHVGDTDYFPYVRVEADWRDHRVTLSGFGYDDAGDGTLANDYGDIAAGASVRTDMDFFNVKAAWSYDVLDSTVWRLAPGLMLETYGLDVEVREVGTIAFEQVETLVFVPMIFLQGEVDLGPVAATLDVGFMDADLGDATGTYWDIEALLRFTPVSHLELFAGYRLATMEAAGVAGDRDFYADIELSGFLLGGGLTF